MFKDLRKLSKQAKEINKDWDVGAQLEQAQAQMAGANDMLAQQTASASAAADGIDATATVVSIRDAGAMINLQPVVEIELTVMPPGRPPYPAKLRQPVPASALPRVQPGVSVPVRIHRDDPAVVHLMLA